MTASSFEHRYAAHCESGVVSSMLNHYGLDLSEAMVFGLSSAITFAYLPFIKLGGLPLIAYRMPPKQILKGVQRQLGIKFKFETFRRPQQGQQRLDELLSQSRVVGLQTSVYWLPYFPKDMRFHFNAHNLLAYGIEGDNYLISDPVFETVVTAPKKDLQKARFAKGVLAPNGLLYYPLDVPNKVDIGPAIIRAIKRTHKIMTKTPLPFIGVRGIRYLAKRIEKLSTKATDEQALFIGHIVRMQEEIGTGGAGFRFIYASFLQEAADVLNQPKLQNHAEELTSIGDQWRIFALKAAKMCRGKHPMDLAQLAKLLRNCADREERFFNRLIEVVKT